jgi:hypothetical protein
MLQVKTAQEIYQILKNSGVIGSTGQINFQLNGISFPVSSKDGIGGLIQEWLGHWASKQGIYLRGNLQTQEFPDYYLTNSNQKDYLEVKSFNYKQSPAFDIADFDAYINSLLNNPNNIYADYLIFGYELQKNGVLIIKDIWLKKIWEITGLAKDGYIKLQNSNNTIKKIRPYNFKGQSKTPPFDSKEEFLNAIQNVLNSHPNRSPHHNLPNWSMNILNQL